MRTMVGEAKQVAGKKTGSRGRDKGKSASWRGAKPCQKQLWAAARRG